MKYINAAAALPEELVEELQQYIQAGYLYIPAKADEHRAWGERSGGRQTLRERNVRIVKAYRDGASMEELAERYFLSVHAIRKIVYRK